MFKLIAGCIIVLLILYIIYQVRKTAARMKEQIEADDELNDVHDKLAALDVKEDVVTKKTELQKRQAKLNKREDKLDKE